MKIKKLWAIYIEKNPIFGGEDDGIIKLTVRGFKKFFDETYRHAHTQGWNEGLSACKSTIAKLKKEKEELQQRLDYAHKLIQERNNKKSDLSDLFKKPPWQ